ncbi:hypothetical protein N665_1456s0010 [Sinapis alba]|nr:hypothetical protein N665_1456s0010 [Sinapis alba]
MGSQSPVYTIPPTMFFEIDIDPGVQFFQDLPKSRIAFAHVLESGKDSCFWLFWTLLLFQHTSECPSQRIRCNHVGHDIHDIQTATYKLFSYKKNIQVICK